MHYIFEDAKISHPLIIKKFYNTVYTDCFLEENERETFENLLYYLKDQDPRCSNHILIIKNIFGVPIGGAVFDYFKEYNFGVIEFICITPKLQSQNLGTALYKEVIKKFKELAHEAGYKHVDFIFCEIEDPEGDQTLKYLNFYRKYNYKRVNYKYIQPPLDENKKLVGNLWIIVNCFTDKQLTKEIFLRFIKSYYSFCMSIPDVENYMHYQYMKAVVGNKDLSLSDL